MHPPMEDLHEGPITEPPGHSLGAYPPPDIPAPIFEDPESYGDIYRGLLGPPPEEPTSPRPEDYFSHPHFLLPVPSHNTSSSSSSSSSSTSSSSSDSSDSTDRGRGLGHLAGVVERAIRRWARGTSSSGSSSSGSSSSSSTTSTESSMSRARSRSRSFIGRRPRVRRRGSVNTVDQHEYSPSRMARRRQILEDSRKLPTEYTLLLPPLAPDEAGPSTPSGARVIKTTSTRTVLAHLEATLRRPQRRPHRRPKMDGRERDRPSKSRVHGLPSVGFVDAMSGLVDSESPSPAPTAVSKGKEKIRSSLGSREASDLSILRPRLSRTVTEERANRTWWLDLASPTWDDMRALGKVSG